MERNFRAELKGKALALAWLAALWLCSFTQDRLMANPQGGAVTQGAAAISGGAGHLVIQQSSDRAVIQWQDFSIQTGETTQFLQPGASSATLSRVIGANPSSIYGTLSANGQLYLINPHGILVGPTGVINAQSFIASTLDVADSEFMAGDTLRFTGPSEAKVENLGTIQALGGDVFLIAKEVVNAGTITAAGGTVGLAGGTDVVLTPTGAGGGKLAVAVSSGSGSVTQTGTIHAVGAELRAAGGNPYALAINNTGIVRATGVSREGGRILLSARAGQVSSTGQLTAGNADGSGGAITVESGGAVSLGGDVSADGRIGGAVNVQGTNVSLADQIHARGTAGKGGSIEIIASGRMIENNGSRNDVSGLTDGGSIRVTAGETVATSGRYLASGTTGRGGRVDISAPDVRLLSTQIDASGSREGGLVRIGGAFQGGKAQEPGEQADRFVFRFQEGATPLPDIVSAQQVFVNDGVRVDISATQGQGGGAVFWSDRLTTFLGEIHASGGLGTTQGGTVEISSGDVLRYADLTGITGASEILLDPKNITIGTTTQTQNWAYEGIIGLGYTASGGNLSMALDSNNLWGISVCLNSAGDRLAVGAIWDGGANNTVAQSGAVYLFSFTDTNFSGGLLQSTIGSGYSGGKNVGLPELEANDFFGHSVLLNPSGDRLAVGAYGDDGFGNATANSGAAYLFSFGDTTFSGGTLEGIMGSGYSGGKNVNVASLDPEDYFGISLSMNSAGDRLAVGASQDGGSGNASLKSGAVYLFSFTDTTFGGGLLQSTIGSGYSGGKNVDVGTLAAGDLLGHGVSLNGAGTRLAAGAYGDDGFGNAVTDAGAVYLFSFSDGTFSGGNVEGIIGSGYSGGKNVGVPELEASDRFGTSISRNTAGDRLAVGGFGDDGASNLVTDSGVVYLFSFTDTNFSGGLLQGTMGSGYSGGKNVAVGTLDPSDYFGISVSLNSTGNRLAVGGHYDDGFGNTLTNSGAVYLFTFTDTTFTGGTLQGTMGSGYSGSKNINVALGANDSFGSAIALNASGNRLAIGAFGDDGLGNTTANSGAVYLFSFTDTNFSGGALQSVIGSGYSGGKNVNVTLEANDQFGSSLSLNAAGDRLAVGAMLDDGSGNTVADSGAVYLFSFTDTNFSGGALQGTLGSGYSGGKNVNVALEANDQFGSSLSLNAAGDRLAGGARLDDGSGNAVADSGAAYLFSFTDTNFSGGALQSTLGSGYGGGKNVNVALEANDQFGSSLSLNAAGDRLAVGAMLDDGSGNAVADSGAVYLFSFTDTTFIGGLLQSTLGRGYSGGKNVNVALEANDQFGSSLSLNAAGDRLAVGAMLDDGSGNAVTDSGAAYLFNFTDTTFTGGTLQSTLGSGYSGGKNMNLALEAGDRFGISMSLNGSGNRWAVGARDDDGSGNAVTDTGATYLFSAVALDGAEPVTDTLYSSKGQMEVTFNAAQLAYHLSQGTALTLQANNDITINTAITVNNASGQGGALTLQAGRSLLINANITTDHGNLTLTANDTTANGVSDRWRDAGAAVITMAAGTTLDVGTGTVTLDLRDGAGKTNSTSGNVTLGNIIAASLSATNHGPTAGSNILQNAGDALTISGTATLTAGNNNITLNNAGNDFGTLSITQAQDVVVRDSNSLVLGAATLRDLTVQTGGNLTQSGALQSTGTLTINNGLGTITLDNASNNITNLGGVSRGGTFKLVDGSGGLTLTGAVGGHASSIEIATTGNLTLSPTTSLTTTGAGEIYLAAQSGYFLNNAGAGVLIQTTPRWIIYSHAASGTAMGGLTETAQRWGSYAANPPGTWAATPGNLLLFAPPPTEPTQSPSPPPLATHRETIASFPIISVGGRVAMADSLAVANPDGNGYRLLTETSSGAPEDIGFQFMTLLNNNTGAVSGSQFSQGASPKISTSTFPSPSQASSLVFFGPMPDMPLLTYPRNNEHEDRLTAP